MLARLSEPPRVLTGERSASSYRASKRPHDPHLFDLFVEESWRSIYAGQLEVRPPGAPTTRPDRALWPSARSLVEQSGSAARTDAARTDCAVAPSALHCALK